MKNTGSHCVSCLEDKNIICPRDVDAICKWCGEGFCGGHIGEHLMKAHLISINLDYCSKN